MEWVTAIKESIRYMEEEMLNIKSPEEVADHVSMSSMHLQRGFQVMTGMSLGEYIRNRRLYLAAMELTGSDRKVIDVALKYGYETPESFTKAFTRFHNATPSQVRKNRKMIRPFLPLRVNIAISGGEKMDYSVEKNTAPFKLIGFMREFHTDTSYEEIPKFWDEVYEKYEFGTVQGKLPANEMEQAIYDYRIGEYGICVDDIGKSGRCRYMIGGLYRGGTVPAGLEIYEVPSHNWAKFRCIGPIPETLQVVNTHIWNEWLPGNNEFELDGNISIEWYSQSGKMSDQDYQSAIWMPVKCKKTN